MPRNWQAVVVVVGLLWGGITSPARGQGKVVLDSQGRVPRLVRDGQPFVVRGVGGETRLELLASLGANSIRTWGTDNLRAVLDEAHKHKLTVCVGMWLGHERHGFDYRNEEAVLKQLESCLATVRQFKDHPAVLLWGVGNEMEGDGKNPAVWYAVDHIAREIKRLDPHHPTLTAIAELGRDANKLRSLERFCPNIDIVGVNSYAGIATLAERYRDAGGTKPYIVTEHGPHGPWEVGKTAWGSALEATSTEKGKSYADGFRKTVGDPSGRCLGSYAFLWGHKQETTATWFGMLLPDGSRLAATEAMSELWTGKPPSNRVPRIEALTLDESSTLKPGQSRRARLVASDPENDRLTITWILRHDSQVVGVGGDREAEERTYAGAVDSQGTTATVTAPLGGGGYRLFAYVSDGRGGAAVANVPLFVDAPAVAVASAKVKLPFTLYGDDAGASVYSPSGFMGQTQAIKQTLDCTDEPQAGKTCLKIEYTATDKWGGVLWQSPPNDWKGEKPGGLDLTGARELEFWARGAAGGETVDFLLGGSDGKALYRDTAKGELKAVRLTKTWQKYRIPLDGRDLSRIKTAFGWSLAGQEKPVTFYVDEIRYVP